MTSVVVMENKIGIIYWGISKIYIKQLILANLVLK